MRVVVVVRTAQMEGAKRSIAVKSTRASLRTLGTNEMVNYSPVSPSTHPLLHAAAPQCAACNYRAICQPQQPNPPTARLLLFGNFIRCAVDLMGNLIEIG